MGRAGWRAMRVSNGAVRHAGKLALEATRIAAGISDVKPERSDWRFRDETWHENALYHRLMQLYLAWDAELEELVDEAGLDWQNAERARFIVRVLTSAVAPTNTLLGNPEALKRLLATGGGSLARGLRNCASDLRSNRGLPSQVAPGSFTVGENLAATLGAVVYRDEVCEVLQFTPSTPEVCSRPILMIAPQINKYYFMDLAPGRSFVEHAVSRGIPFFAVSWRNPTSEQREWNLDTYAAAVLRAIDIVREISQSDDVNMLSLCAGGILTTAVLNHLAASGDARVNAASFGVTLLDFAVPAPIGVFQSRPLLAASTFVSGRRGVLDGATLGSVFTWMRPNDLVWKYWVNNYLLGNPPPSFDILAWNADTTNLPAALHAQFLELFRHNSLASGTLTVLGTPIDLGRITTDIYVTGATADHLTPWRGCYRTTQLFGGESTFILSNAGHMASLINPPGNPKAHYFAGPVPGPDPDQWAAQAERHQGSWWDHWADWVLARGGVRPAPNRLGSRRHRVLEAAPGQYIRGVSGSAA